MKIISKKDKILLKRISKYIKPYKFIFVFVVICISANIVLALLQPLIWGKLLTAIFEKNYNIFIQNIGYISIISIGQVSIHFIESYLYAFLSNNLMHDLKCDIYEKIINLPIKVFDSSKTGDLISRLHEDTLAITNTLTYELLDAFTGILKVILIGIAVFKISKTLTFITIAFFPISYFLFLIFGKILRKKNKSLMEIKDTYFSEVQQTITGIREIKSLGIKNNIMNTFSLLSLNLKNKEINLSVTETFSSAIAQIADFLMQIMILFVGGMLILNNKMIMEHFVAFSSYSKQFSYSLMKITKINSSIQKVLVSIERIFDMIDGLSDTKETFGNLNVKDVKNNIIFKDVHFKYNEKANILRNISFKIPIGKKIALVGLTGSGKTTIFNLLMRFYSPNSGKIFIDKIDINEIDETSLASLITIVRQNPIIFNMSIKNNFLIVKPNATEDEIKNACVSSGVHDYIMKLPEKYETIIGENSVNLSGGQKQQIAIARALIKKSKVILLDEITSSLDNETQDVIKNSISKISNKHTVITIAHRLSTIIESDEIILLDNGSIVGIGNHENLLRSNKFYKKLYESELKSLQSVSV